jgi:hypothetical protein
MQENKLKEIITELITGPVLYSNILIRQNWWILQDQKLYEKSLDRKTNERGQLTLNTEITGMLRYYCDFSI